MCSKIHYEVLDCCAYVVVYMNYRCFVDFGEGTGPQ